MISSKRLILLVYIPYLCLADIFSWFTQNPHKFLDKSVYDDPSDAVRQEFANIGGLRCAYLCALDDDCTGFNHQGRRISDRGHCQLMAALEADNHEFTEEAVIEKLDYSYYDKREYLFLVTRAIDSFLFCHE